MKNLIYPGVCRLHDVYMTEAYAYLVMELVAGRELFELVKESQELSEARARNIFSQLVTAVQYLHSMGTIHNDLKLENVLINEDDDITLIDFGHASRIDNASFKPGIPTLEYVAPELLVFGEFTEKVCSLFSSLFTRTHLNILLFLQSDIWSLGIVLYIMVLGYFPFHGTDESIRKQIIESKPKFTRDKIGKDCRDLIKRMLCKDPKERITMEEVKNHPWFLQGLAHYTEPESEQQQQQSE